jgi:hypothetical protein
MFEAIRLYCSFTDNQTIVIETCYLYCYACKQLIAGKCSPNEAYEKTRKESERRAKISGFSSIKFWIENDVESSQILLPKDWSQSEIRFIFGWSLFYLRHNYSLNDALNDIVKKGGNIMANATIVGGLIGASVGVRRIDKH